MIRNLNRWLIIAIIVIIASGMALTLWTIQREDTLLRTDLLIKTRHLSSDISTEHVKGLTGSESDLGSSRLRDLKKSDDTVPCRGSPDPVRLPDGAAVRWDRLFLCRFRIPGIRRLLSARDRSILKLLHPC